MSWLLDRVPDDDFDERPPDEDERAPRAAPDALPSRRSMADDVLDAVGGRKRVEARDLMRCPVCNAETRGRNSTVGATTIVRQCLNRACRLEYPIASVASRAYMPPVPPDPVLSSGPYANGPSRGSGSAAPPIDMAEPLHRRLAEHVRRINHDGE